MENVIELRKNQPFLVGQLVAIGSNTEAFEISNLGLCGPIETEIGPLGFLKNASEFVQLKVPGTDGNCFNIHASFLRRI